MTVNDIKNIQILINLKNGQKLLGVTNEMAVFITLAKLMQFIQVDEEKFNKVDIKEILK